MKKIFNIIKNHVFLFYSCTIFFIISIINTLSYTGLFMDMSGYFFLTLQFFNIFLTDFNILEYRLIMRYFPTFIPQISVFTCLLFNITDIKFLVSIFTYMTYFSVIVFLIILYLNIPKSKKNVFNLILLFFLMSSNYMKYAMLSESYLTFIFLFIVFVIYYYYDLKNLSMFNLISLIIFSFFLISSHQNVTVLIPVYLYIGIKKYIQTKNIPVFSKFIIVLSIFILFIAFILNVYFIVNPVVPYSDYLQFGIFLNHKFLLFVVPSFLVILCAFLDKTRNKFLFYFVIFLSVVIFIMGIQIVPIEGIHFRMINLYFVLLAVLFLIAVDYFNMNINYLYIKIVNFVLLLTLLISTILYCDQNNKLNKIIIENMRNSKEISVEKFKRNNIKNKYDVYSAILFKKIFLASENKCTININGKYHLEYFKNEYLQKIGINVEDILKYN